MYEPPNLSSYELNSINAVFSTKMALAVNWDNHTPAFVGLGRSSDRPMVWAPWLILLSIPLRVLCGYPENSAKILISYQKCWFI